jgi:hypothetical protein
VICSSKAPIDLAPILKRSKRHSSRLPPTRPQQADD